MRKLLVRCRRGACHTAILWPTLEIDARAVHHVGGVVVMRLLIL